MPPAARTCGSARTLREDPVVGEAIRLHQHLVSLDLRDVGAPPGFEAAVARRWWRHLRGEHIGLGVRGDVDRQNARRDVAEIQAPQHEDAADHQARADQ